MVTLLQYIYLYYCVQLTVAMLQKDLAHRLWNICLRNELLQQRFSHLRLMYKIAQKRNLVSFCYDQSFHSFLLQSVPHLMTWK